MRTQSMALDQDARTNQLKETPVKVIRLTRDDLLVRRNAALARLGMDLATARAQWTECGCCLVNGNWEDLLDLEAVREADYLLDEPIN